MAVTTLENMVVIRRTDDVALYAMTSPTNIIGANSVTLATGQAIGFTFTFGGNNYTTFAVHPAGYVRFAGTLNTTTNANLFTTATAVALAPWFDSQETATTVGYVQKEIQGTAPRRRLVIEWYNNLTLSHDATNYHRAKFQCILHETIGKAEFRYGPIERGGNGGTITSSATMAAKASTSVISDNYRDFAVDDFILGGSRTTTTSNLTYASQWPNYSVHFQPNYPMDGRVRLLGPDKLSGLQDKFSQPLQDFANNVNHHYCNHAPPLINISPDLHGLTISSTDQTLVIPVYPSGDGLSYTFYLGIYSTANTAHSLTIDREAVTDPQPLDNADWTNIEFESAITNGYAWWTPFNVVIPADAEYLRFQLTGTGDAAILSELVVPTALTEPPSSTTAIGWTRVGIGQIAVQGAGQHPEYLNRCDRNIGLVLRDRKQMVWSATRAHSYSFTYNNMTLVSVAPCSLVGQRGATLQAVIYAHDSTDGGEVVIRESGGSSAKFIVDDNGGEFRRQTLPLTLNSDQPLIEMSVKASGTLKVMFAGLIWTPGD